MKKLLLFVAIVAAASSAWGQAFVQNEQKLELPETMNENTRINWRVPQLEGYTALRCDFHHHTVFSDGEVWPTGVVDEAWRDGLDAIAITDHIEGRLYKDIIFFDDLNIANRIAQQRGEQIGMLVIPGAEITRNKPFGHINALFVEDVEKLRLPDELDVIEEANRQGCFLLWNHPAWPDNLSTYYDLHDRLIKAGKLHGVEVSSYHSHYPVTRNWSHEHGLAYTADSDAHQPLTTHYSQPKTRPLNITYVRERSVEGIKEALFAARNIGVFGGRVVGPRELLESVVRASLSVERVGADDKGRAFYNVSNNTDLEFMLRVDGYLYRVGGGTTLRVRIESEQPVAEFPNCYYSETGTISIPFPF